MRQDGAILSGCLTFPPYKPFNYLTAMDFSNASNLMGVLSSIPLLIFQNMTFLKLMIYLSENSFSMVDFLPSLATIMVSIKSFLMQLHVFVVLEVSFLNGFKCMQKALVDLRLSNTSLSISSIPTSFAPQNVTILNLANNQIMGTLPTTIGDQMPKLEMLFLSDNLINGSLPLSICKWKNLKKFENFGSFKQ